MNGREQEVQIKFGDVVATEYVTSVGGNSYRLEATPLLVDGDEQLWLGDIIRIDPGEEGVLLFRGMASRSPRRHIDWLLGSNGIVRDPINPRKVIGETSALVAFKKRIEAAGGLWEQALVGNFIIHLPEHADFDPDEVWAKCLAKFGSGLATPEEPEDS